jgi:hypothetical protein
MERTMDIDDKVTIRATVFSTPDPECDDPEDRFYTLAIEPVASVSHGRELVSVYERDVDKVVAGGEVIPAEDMPIGSVVAGTNWAATKTGDASGNAAPWAVCGSALSDATDLTINRALRTGQASVLRIGTGDER